MSNRLTWAVSACLLAHAPAPAHAINATYAKQLERSGCTQVSETQGCDIHKTRAANAKAGFAMHAAATHPPKPHPVSRPATSDLGFSVRNMDPKADPRRDFVRYASGAWLDRTPIPASEGDAGRFGELAHQLDQRLLRIIHDAARQQAAVGTPVQQVGDFYRAASDLKRRDALGLQPIEAMLKAIDNAQLDDPAELARMSARLQLGFMASPIVNVDVGADYRDSKVNALALGPGQQVLSRDEYLQPQAEPIRRLYLNHMMKMFRTLGDTPRQAWDAASTVLAMETDLARAQMTTEQGRDPQFMDNHLSLDEAQALVPALDLRALLSALGVPPPATLIAPDLGGLKGVQAVWGQRSLPERRTLLRWHALTTLAGALGQPWRGLDQAFTMQRNGLTQPAPLDVDIERLMGVVLPHPLSRLYVQRHFTEQTRREVSEMVGHIREEFTERLRLNPWLDDATRAAALDKLSRIEIQVGHPAEGAWIDFSGVRIRADDHFGNLQRLGEFRTRHQLAKLGQPAKPERFAEPGKTTPIAVNAAYNPQTNGIDITAAIVQPPFYTPGADAAVNYCTMGAVIGHEITHGFDSFGRQFGPAGNLRDWWTPQAATAFQQRADMLVKQYSEVEILPGLMHNGSQTVTENTADLGGITLAHAALKRSLQGKLQAPIDGLNADQRCFVAWAQLWSYKARPERLRMLVSIDYHAISTLRATLPLRNLDAFHEAFGIREGDPMWRAPAQRVRIW